ncbi:MAG: hypothetical protein M3Q51_01960 [Pseudomonadota bacterium]|nr:hypothetical protein [Pseudomonadota bacterium]MDQ3159770.1 hypothetical protein [Pseudomonadota bacterium]
MSSRTNFLALSLIAFAAALPGCDRSEQTPAAPEAQASDSAAPAEVAGPATNAGDVASRYDGKIVRQPPGAGGKEDGWFLVKDGMRRWISDGAWLEKNGYSPDSVIEISREEFQALPENPLPVEN